MEIRNAIHPEHARQFDTKELREHFLIKNLFKPDEIKMIYSYYDRLIVGGICPHQALTLEVDEKIIGASYLLQRREMGVINIGAKGRVSVDGEDFDMDSRDGLFIGMGAEAVVFSSSHSMKLNRFSSASGKRATKEPFESTFIRMALRAVSWSWE